MKLLKTLILLIPLSFLMSQTNTSTISYLIYMDLDDQENSVQIEYLKLPLLYQIDQTALLKVNINQIEELERDHIKFKILDRDINENSYYLIKIEDLSKEEQLESRSIGSIKDYFILKNVNEESIRDLSKKIHISPLNLRTPQPFSQKKYIPNQINADIDPLISEVIEDINSDSVEFVINKLQQYGTRFMLAPNRFEVSEWIYDQFIRFGFTDVEYDTFTAHTSISYAYVHEDTVTVQRNVVATLHGSGDPDAVFIVCGHYDSFNSFADPFRIAPGADDDASGTAAVLEMARVFMENGFTPSRTIKFIAMGAEELMNFGDGGSEHYAALSDSLDTDIRMVINHDMISHTDQSLTNSTINVNHHYTADHFADLAIEKIEEYTQINGALDDYYGADLGPFIDHGYTGIYFEESEFSPYYHSSDDVIENYSMDFCTEVIKASCATLIECSTIPTSPADFIITDRGDGNSLLISWSPSLDYNFDHYKIYVGIESGVYDREETTNETSYLIEQLTSGTEYFIGISVVDSDGFESIIREGRYIPFYFSLDQGILVIDETADGDGSLSKPSDEQVDQFYENVLDNFAISHWDLIDNSGISLTDFGSYSTIIWQADDSQNMATLDSILNELGRFLDAGGNFLYAGYMPCQAVEGTFAYPDTFGQGDFIYDYLKISSTNKGFGTRFSGATADESDYFNIHIETTKTQDFSGLHLKNIESIEATTGGKNILFYDSDYDSSSSQGRMIGEPVGIEYIGEDYKAITLTFPLYYMHQEQAQEILEYILSEKFSEPLDIPVSVEITPDDFKLNQNYPNPFNPSTIISWQLPVNSDIELSIYNIIGERVATLVSEKQSAGHHLIEWNASGLASGVYFYRLETSKNFVKTKKLVLIK